MTVQNYEAFFEVNKMWIV